jgi:hypothetical protein
VKVVGFLLKVEGLLLTDPSEDPRWGHAIRSAQPLINRLAFDGYRVIYDNDEDLYPDLAAYFDDFCFTNDVFSPRELYWRAHWSMGVKVVIMDLDYRVLWDEEREALHQENLRGQGR